MEKHIKNMEMWFLRRMMRIPWTARKINSEILIEANVRTKTHHCRPEEKTDKVYRSCSSKEEARGHHDNRIKYVENKTEEVNEKRYWTAKPNGWGGRLQLN
jgi:hypothetical protein